MPFYTGQLEAEKRKQVLGEAMKIISDPQKWTPDEEAGRVRFKYNPKDTHEKAVGTAIYEALISIVNGAQWMLVNNTEYANATTPPHASGSHDEAVVDNFLDSVPPQLHSYDNYVNNLGTPTEMYVTVNPHVLEGVRAIMDNLQRMGIEIVPTQSPERRG